MAKKRRSLRMLIQIMWTALSNGFLYGFYARQIYKGPLKRICLPGLNCYSCPGALGSCPLGALQGVITSWKFDFSFFVVGALMFFGALLGRAVCGFLCPFGLVQDIVYKIPFFRKRKSLPFHKVLVFLKYAILIVFVGILPLTMNTYKTGTPAFCKYICPSGTLMGALTLVPGNEMFQDASEPAAAEEVKTPANIGTAMLVPSGGARLNVPGAAIPLAPGVAVSAQPVSQSGASAGAVGGLFYWKVGLLSAFLILSLYVYRPFCKYFCPLGAVYSLFSRLSVVKMKVDKNACVGCGACKRVCKMSVDPSKTPNSAECIRCGDCIRTCPMRALSYDTPFSCARRRRAECADSDKQCENYGGGTEEC